MIAAIFNLNHPANTVHWHFFSMSVSNVVVIVVMLVVFAVAILAPFPRHSGTREERSEMSVCERNDVGNEVVDREGARARRRSVAA